MRKKDVEIFGGREGGSEGGGGGCREMLKRSAVKRDERWDALAN